MDADRRAVLVQRRKDLRSTRHLCEHGVTAPDYDDDRGCAGAIKRCRCCSQYYCYWTSGGNDGVTEWLRSPPDNLCRDCGGLPIEYERPLPDPWTPWTT